jgi:hypothetical protein
MSRPTWVIFYSIFIILIGGCGILDKLADTQAEKSLSIFENINLETNTDFDTDEVDDSKVVDITKDTLSEAKVDSINERLKSLFGDTLIMGEDNKVDMKATIGKSIKMSEYRIKWTKTFGWIGVCFGLLFVIGGILMLTKNKLTIPFILTILSTSMAVGLFKYFIFKADTGSGQLVNMGGKFDVLWSIALDVILLIVFMVVDKSYFGEEKYKEDFG